MLTEMSDGYIGECGVRYNLHDLITYIYEINIPTHWTRRMSLLTFYSIQHEEQAEVSDEHSTIHFDDVW